MTKEGRTYYYNRYTKQSAWEKPSSYTEAGSDVTNATVPLSSASVGATTSDWEELWDPKNERAYYYNRTSRKTQWQRPKGVAIKPHAGALAGREKRHEKHRNKGKKNDEKDPSRAADKDLHWSEAMSEENPVLTEVKHQVLHDEHVSLKKKKKKSKRDKGDSVAWENPRKRRRQDEKRLIIWDDDERVGAQDMTKEINEKDTVDGKEATRLLHELSKTDAIMEANVLSVINGFLRAHTESDGPEILVEKLSSSYRGHAQMIGLVASWLDTLPVSTTAVESKMTFDVNEGAVIANKGATWDPAEEILYNHLKDVINENYDPKLVSNVLSGSAVEPAWLTQMLNDRKWRLMLIQLAETHKVVYIWCVGRSLGLQKLIMLLLMLYYQTCTLLQYAIRRISEAGHHKEIASITSANAFFPVFSGVLVDAFSRVSIVL